MGNLLTLALGLTVIGVMNMSEAKSKNQSLEVQGHRGARAVFPENTLAGFDYALKVGVDTLELDLAVTKDNVLVISHDPFINPTICLGPGGKKLGSKTKTLIRQLSFKQLQEFDCGSLKNPRFPEQQPVAKEKIPSLEQLFGLVKASKHPASKRVKFNIETKIVPAYEDATPEPEEFVQLVVALVKKYKLVSRVTLQSFDDRTLVVSKRLEPKIKTALLIAYNHVDMVTLAKGIGADIISPNHEWILKTDVVALHKAGVQVIPWTVNDPQGWSRLIKMGVDGIITDHPQALFDYLKTQGL